MSYDVMAARYLENEMKSLADISLGLQKEETRLKLGLYAESEEEHAQEHLASVRTKFKRISELLDIYIIKYHDLTGEWAFEEQDIWND